MDDSIFDGMKIPQLDFAEQQLGILKNIFASEEDGVAVEKELMNQSL